ncbi:hypothetical protein ACFLQG_01445, partial [Candidatus Zixiibacteriota bacterium]
MELSGRIIRQIILLSMVVLIVPMLIFPERLGLDLVKASFLNAMFELTFYAFAIFIFFRKARLSQLIQMAGLCLIYRFALGLVFGILIVLMYPMKMSIALSLGMSSYLPAIFLHIATAPFILKPIIDNQLEERVSRVTIPQPKTVSENTGLSFVATKEKVVPPQEKPKALPVEKIMDITAAPGKKSINTPEEYSGFEEAVKYISSDGSVQLVSVIDNEGLLLASFKRGDFDPEKYTPHTLSLIKTNNQELKKFGFEKPQKIEYLFDDT